MLLDFGDRTRTGIFSMVWPLANRTYSINYLNFLKLWKFHASKSIRRGNNNKKEDSARLDFTVVRTSLLNETLFIIHIKGRINKSNNDYKFIFIRLHSLQFKMKEVQGRENFILTLSAPTYMQTTVLPPGAFLIGWERSFESGHPSCINRGWKNRASITFVWESKHATPSFWKGR